MTNGLNSAATAFLSSLKVSVQKHPKRLTAILAAALLTGGGGAFAVASLGPDPADLPMVTITESVPSLAVDAELADLSGIGALALYRSDITRSNDTPEAMLQRLGIADPVASGFLRSDALSQQNLLGRAGRVLSAEAGSDQALIRLTARWAPDDSGTFKRLVVQRQEGGTFASRIESAPLSVGTRLGSGAITSSLFAATDAANIPDAVAVQLAEIFSGSIDFRRALRKGDHFSVVYESLEADGEPMRTGRVLSAEFFNNGKTYSAVWFQDSPQAKGAYYTLAGNSMNRAYLTSPVAYTRVTSGFAMRFHPILKTWRNHLGIDLAAPSGTPVRTIGDGTVSFAGVQNGYGNVIHVQHANQHETVYAHLSRIDVRQGQAVSQGQTIGAVGQTGWATGPHLHFEFKDHGKQVDPMATALRSQEAAPIAQAQRPAFDRLVAQMRIELTAADQTLVTAQAN